MSILAESPVPFRILSHGGHIGGDERGWGAQLTFHVGAGLEGGQPTDVLTFLDFVGGSTESVVIGGVAVERIVPLRHPYLPHMVAQAAAADSTGKGINAAPGWTDWKVRVDFAAVPYDFSGDQPYFTLRRTYGASSITLPGQAYAVAGVKLNHDVARNIPEVVYNATKYNVPDMDDSIYKTLAGKVNASTFLDYAPKTVRFDGVQDEITTMVGQVRNRTVSLSLAWRPVSWNAILLPSGVWAEPQNIADGSGFYLIGNFDLLLQ